MVWVGGGRRSVERMLRFLIDTKIRRSEKRAARERPRALLQQKREGKFKMVRGEGVERGRTSILVWQPAVVGDHYSAKVGRIGGRIVEIWAPQSVMKRERKSILVYDLIYFKATTGVYKTLKSKFVLQNYKGYPRVFLFSKSSFHRIWICISFR